MLRTIGCLSVVLVGLATETGAQMVVERDQALAPPTIAVRGRGEVAAPPNMATIRMGAVVQNERADAAQAQVNQVMQRAIQAIIALNVPSTQVQTAGISLQPVYTQPPPQPLQRGQLVPQEPRIAGYRASNAVQVRLDNLQLLGQVIDAAVAAGANQLEDLSFQIKDDTQYRQEALGMATREAHAKAQAIAGALGVRLASVQQVEEAGVETIRPQYGRRLMATAAEAAAPTPVQPGEVRVEANVIVTYRIGGSGAGEGARPMPVLPGAAPATQPGQ